VATVKHSELGSGSLEFALSLTLLLTIMLGIMEMSLALYTYCIVSESAREGTRYAAVRGSSCSSYGGFSSACPVTAAQIQTYVRELNFPGIKPSAMTVSTTWAAYPSGGSCTPSASCDNPGNLVKVTVSYAFPLTIPFVSNTTITMASTSKMVIAD
jgi:Flp pilus assembly protein TadG